MGERIGRRTIVCLGWLPDLDLFEIIDPDTGELLPDGETGELVYTPIDGRGSIVLRYRTGDIVEGGLTRERCPGCGRTVPRFSSNLSRQSNQKDFELTKIKGALVNLNALADLLNGHAAVDEWQLVIQKKNNDPYECDELVLFVALVGDHAAERALVEIGEAVEAGVEIRPQVELLTRTEILERTGMETQLKENRIVDLREAGSTSSPEVAGSAVEADRGSATGSTT
ncbi:MAG: hypothetical protein AAF488_06545 [Planctomycetota bacterium]